MKSCVLIMALLLFPIILKSQDKIILKDGREIKCQVTKIDSSNIYFSMVKNNHTIRTMIKYKDVSLVNFSDEIPEKPVKVKSAIRNSISVSAGKCISRNEFLDDDVLKEDAGFAGTGSSVNVNYKYFLTKSFGFSLKGSYNANEYKAEKIGKAISYMIRLPVSNNTVKYDSYSLITGPTYLATIDRLMLEGHAGLGFGNLTEPEVTFSITSGNNVGWIKKNSITASSVLYNFGAGLVYNLTDNWQIVGNIDFLEGSFKFGENTLVGGSGETSELLSRKQDYEVYSITLGIGLKF